MVRNKKVTGTAKSIPVGICMGIAAALSVTLIGALITAWLLNFERIEENAIGYCAMVILLLASIMGSITVQAQVKHQKLMMCAAAGISYYLILVAITALFFGGQYQGMGVTALVIAAGTGVAVLMNLKGDKGRQHKLKKYGYG